MSRIIIRRVPELTRQRLADPLFQVPFWSRLKVARCVDLRDNLVIEDLGGGYARAVPIDQKIRWGKAWEPPKKGQGI